MNASRLAVLVGLAAAWLGGSCCQAGEIDAAVQAVLAKWEKASHDCRSLDAKLTVFHYDAIWRDQPKTMHGRFYYEAPHAGFCQIWGSGEEAVSFASQDSETTIWRDQETLLLSGRAHTCAIYSKAPLKPYLSGDGLRSDNAWQRFFGTLANAVARYLDSPQEAFPLMVDVRASDVRQRFDVTMERNGDEIVLKAVPKRSADQAVFRDIRVMLNGKTYMTRATEVNGPDGRSRVVCVLDDQKVNQRPKDHDTLLAPDLSGFDVTRVP